MNERVKLSRMLAVCLVAMVLTPATAHAGHYTIGSNLTRPNDSYALCANDGCVGVQTGIASLPSPPPPSDGSVSGAITSWSVRSGDTGALYSIRVLQPITSNSFTARGRSQATFAIPPGPETVHTFPAMLPIQPNEAIGLELGGGASGLPMHGLSSPSDTVGYNTAGIADGSTAPFTDGAPYELLVQATITYCKVPKLIGKRAREARRLLAAADCGVKVIKRQKKRKRSRGRVLFQRSSPGVIALPSSKIAIGVAVKPKKKKR
jgi:hypothetical protein